MNSTVEFQGYLLTSDEIEACKNLLTQIRTEKAHQQAIQKAKMSISFEIAAAVEQIGLDETKRIVRELNRELRGL